MLVKCNTKKYSGTSEVPIKIRHPTSEVPITIWDPIWMHPIFSSFGTIKTVKSHCFDVFAAVWRTRRYVNTRFDYYCFNYVFVKLGHH
jgi:hypothetical protein